MSKYTKNFRFNGGGNWDDIEEVKDIVDPDDTGIDISGDRNTYRIKELDLSTISPKSVDDDGVRYTIIGKPGTGKTSCILSLLYFKKHIIPCGSVHSGTEDSSGIYGSHFPDLFIYDSVTTSNVDNFIKRQKIAKQHLKNPWAFVLWDDVSENKKFLNSESVQRLYKNGRHYKMMLLLALQYAMDIKPVIRTCIDGSFIGRETSESNRKKLWINYAAAIPSLPEFNAIMDEVTEDKTFLFINNKTDSNRPEDCLAYYKAPLDKIPEDWRFGSESYWRYSEARSK